MPIPDPSKIYENPVFVNQMVDTFNKEHVGKLSAADRATLLSDHALAEAVFSGNIFDGGIKDLIGQGYVSVDELKGKPELQQSLRNRYVTTAIKEGVLSIGQLEKVAPEKLKEFNYKSITGEVNNPAVIGDLLGLDAEKSQAFMDSMTKPNIMQGPTIIIPLIPSPVPREEIPKQKLYTI